MISTILLLPHADTREPLLAPCAPVWICAEPEVGEAAEFGTTVDPATPVVDDYDDSDDSDPRDRIKVSWPSLGVCGSVVAALYLVLARDGAEVYEGTDRLRRVIGAEKSVGFLIPPEVPSELHEAYRLARYAEWAGLGAPLFLGADGSEVSP